VEYVGIESIKRAYRDALQSKGRYEEASSLNQKKFADPIYEGLVVHAETEPNLDIINNALQRIAVDIIALNSQYGSVANLYNDLMSEVLTDLESVNEIIGMEEERIQDLNIILGNISSFTSVKTFTANDLSGTCSIEDERTFMCHSTDRTSVNLTVEDVSGNGYEGNSYVRNNGGYEKDIVDSSVRNKMIDESSVSYYEYSRLSVPKDTKDYPSDANFDNTEAECTVLISSDDTFNSIKLQSDITNVSVEQISISEDGGMTYVDTMYNPIRILEDSKKYEDNSYIYGSGLLCFPATHYAKIRLKSNGTLSEQLAFSKIVLDGIVYLKDITFDASKYVYEYLVPTFNAARNSDVTYSKIPLSVLICIALVRTGIKPANAGMFNFWDLQYDTTLCTLPEDKGKCAFTDRVQSGLAVFRFIMSKLELMSSVTELPDNPSECTAQQCKNFGAQILQFMVDDIEVATNIFNDYYTRYDLQQIDKLEIIKELTYETRMKYEQYFMRFDKQPQSYAEALQDAETVIQLNGARRHVIRINDITAFTSTYDTESYLETGELISGPVDCIAVFSNEYYPPVFPTDASIYGLQDYLTYILTVNGTDYTVVPVNSQKDGIKIIRFSDYTITEDYTVHIDEPVKTAKLKVKFITPNQSYSPYLSNLKVCLGKAVIQQ